MCVCVEVVVVAGKVSHPASCLYNVTSIRYMFHSIMGKSVAIMCVVRGKYIGSAFSRQEQQW